MATKLFKYELGGFVFCCILGTLMHFFYEWSGDLTIIGILCPVNESVWEHLKLIFYPFIFWEIAEYFIFNEHTPLAFSKLCGALCGMTATLAVHYIYTGASGKESMAADIISFVLGIGAAFGVSFLIMKNRTKKNRLCESISIICTVIICLLLPFLPLCRRSLPFLRTQQTAPTEYRRKKSGSLTDCRFVDY